MLDIRNLSYHYKKGDHSLNDVSLQLERGKLAVLLGKNGSGKSTLMKCLLSLNKGYEGEILLDGKNIKEIKSKEAAKLISYLPQDIPHSSLTVYDTLLLGRLPYLSYRNREKKKDDYLDPIIQELHLENIVNKASDELSGGERQKVMIAKALVQECKLLVLDEPTSSLDIENQTLLLKLLKRLVREKNISVLLSIHDINLALRFADEFFLMKDGNMIYKGEAEKITEQQLEETFDTKFRLQTDEYGYKFISIGE